MASKSHSSLAASIAGKELMPIDMKTAVTVGFLGAFTTFSTFIFESYELIRAESWKILAAYLIGSVLVGLLALLFGLRIPRLVG